jgi:hypothetical protein
VRLLIATLALLIGASASASPDLSATFSTIVDAGGNISLPQQFKKSWVFLGAWAVANEDADTVGAAALHNVYVQPDAITAYRQTGEFPDGTVLIKELLTTATGPMTTGSVSWGQKIDGWFIMVKDRQNRFPQSALWGEGWGWVLINSDAPDKIVTTNYKNDCLGCHIPARNTDWVYTQAYPNLSSD